MGLVVVVVTSLLGVVVRDKSGNKSRMPRPSSGLGIGIGLTPPLDSMMTLPRLPDGKIRSLSLDCVRVEAVGRNPRKGRDQILQPSVAEP